MADRQESKQPRVDQCGRCGRRPAILSRHCGMCEACHRYAHPRVPFGEAPFAHLEQHQLEQMRRRQGLRLQQMPRTFSTAVMGRVHERDVTPLVMTHDDAYYTTSSPSGYLLVSRMPTLRVELPRFAVPALREAAERRERAAARLQQEEPSATYMGWPAPPAWREQDIAETMQRMVEIMREASALPQQPQTLMMHPRHMASSNWPLSNGPVDDRVEALMHGIDRSRPIQGTEEDLHALENLSDLVGDEVQLVQLALNEARRQNLRGVAVAWREQEQRQGWRYTWDAGQTTTCLYCGKKCTGERRPTSVRNRYYFFTSNVPMTRRRLRLAFQLEMQEKLRAWRELCNVHAAHCALEWLSRQPAVPADAPEGRWCTRCTTRLFSDAHPERTICSPCEFELERGGPEIAECYGAGRPTCHRCLQPFRLTFRTDMYCGQCTVDMQRIAGYGRVVSHDASPMRLVRSPRAGDEVIIDEAASWRRLIDGQRNDNE